MKTDTYCKRSRGISSSRPACASVKTHAFVGHYPEDAPSSERFGICLPLNFEDVEREKDDLSNTDKTITTSETSHPLSQTDLLTSQPLHA